jgi:pilus assembly protein CpaB
MAKAKTTAVAITVAALVLASIAAFMVYNYLSTKQKEADTAKIGVQQIVVAATEIPFGTRLQAAQLKVAGWPRESVPVGSFTDTKAAENRIAVANIMPGSPITETSLAPASSTSGVLSFIIPEGHRAITVAVNEVVGVAGFILPNSIVDVVATVNSPYASASQNNRISKIILQNVKVLAVGQILEQKDGKPVTVPTVTLDVLPIDAEKLAIASENKVQLILKHLGDKEEVKTTGATVATILGGQAPPKVAAAGGRRAAPRKPVAAKPAAPAVQPYSVDIIQGDKKTREEFK